MLWPVLITFSLSHLHQRSEHDDKFYVFLPNSSPEILFRIWERTLSGNKYFSSKSWFDEIGINVSIWVWLALSLRKTHTCVFVRSNVWVPIKRLSPCDHLVRMSSSFWDLFNQLKFLWKFAQFVILFKFIKRDSFFYCLYFGILIYPLYW
jgi:hypothetical protein